MSHVAILILAAGSSSRMRGADKLLEKVDTDPILRMVAEQATQTGCPVFVTLPAGNVDRLDVLAGLALTQVEVENAAVGMSASLAAGLAILPRATKAVMVILADMPDLTLDDLNAVLYNFAETDGNTIVRATDDTGNPGHPVIFPARLFPELCKIDGDKGGMSILKDEDIHWVKLPDNHATTDLDTPEDWATWRKTNPFRN